MRRLLIFVILLAGLSSCEGKYQPDDIPQIVVEGWIEDGGCPVVMLTTTIPVYRNTTEWASLKDNVIRWAKVSVSDGENEEVLTGKSSNDYFPPYVYTTARLMGEAGKTYELKVEYSGRTVTAKTTIPDPVPLEWIKVVRAEEEGSADIIAGLKDDPDARNHYKFFTKVMNEDSSYVSSFMGLIDDSVLSDGVNEIMIQRGMPQMFGYEDISNTFKDDSFVLIRFSTMDEVSYAYWEDYEDIASLSRNPFFPVSRKIRSNVEGGLGYWAGYGSSYYRISIADSLKVR